MNQIKSNYTYSKIFIEGFREESNEYLIVLDHEAIIVNQLTETLSGRVFSKVIYEQALNEIIDLETSTIKKAFATYTPKNEILLVEKETKTILIEVKGRKISLQVSEGDKIKPRQKIAYVLTKKFEVRSIKSTNEGIVVYIGWVYEERPERYVIVVVNSNDVRRLKLRKGAST